MAKDDNSYARQIADSAIVILTSRLSAPLLLAVCTWIGSSIVGLKTDLAGLTGTVNASIAGINVRVGDLENWKNDIAASLWDKHNGNQSN